MDNKLSLHVGKTESLLFGTSRRLSKVDDYVVTCDDEPVKRVSSVKYLGVFLDENLSGKEHAESLISKCTGRLSFLYRKAAFLDFYSRKTLCASLIQPYLDYCCSSWYSSVSKHFKNRLDVLQRRMLRFVFSKSAMDHVDTKELKYLSWLSIPDRVLFFKIMHIFKIRNGSAPNYLIRNFTTLATAHSYKTRGSSFDYFISKEVAQSPNTFAYTGIKGWNSLPNSLKEIESESVFRARLKEFLLSGY